jgi:hypothetical protein
MVLSQTALVAAFPLLMERSSEREDRKDRQRKIKKGCRYKPAIAWKKKHQ